MLRHFSAEIRQTAGRRDKGQVLRHVHNLGEQAEFFSARALAESAKTLKAMAQEDNWSHTQAAIAAILVQLERVSEQLPEGKL